MKICQDDELPTEFVDGNLYFSLDKRGNNEKYRLTKEYKYSNDKFSYLSKEYKVVKSYNHFHKKSAQKGKKDWIVINKDRLVIERGFCWDGVTVAADKVCKIRASLIHDALYSLKRETKLPLSLIDIHKIFRDICIEDGTSKVEAYADFTLLCAFGWMFL